MSLNSNSWNRIRYTVYVPFYDAIVKLFAGQRRRSIELLNIQPGEKVLILGAGTGLDLDYMPKGVSITAIDITPAMVNKIRKRAENLGLQVDFRVMDGQNLEFADESFDCVILHLILAVIPDPYKCIAEVERVLGVNGRAVIFDKFLPEKQKPSIVRKSLNYFTSILFSDINRRLGQILTGTSLNIEHEESAGFNDNFKIALVRKK